MISSAVLSPSADARHAAVLPHRAAELAMERRHRASALDREEPLGAVAHRGSVACTSALSARDGLELVRAEIVADRERHDEVAVRQTLHQRARAEPVRAVVGEVRFADDVQTRNGAHQVVVHPEPAHRVVHGRVDAHRHVVRILVGDALVHLEQIAVALGDLVACRAGGWRRRSRGRRRARPDRRRGLRRTLPSPRATRCRAATRLPKLGYLRSR